MKVRARVLAGLLISTLLLCGAIVAIIQTVVVESFHTLETIRFERNVARVENALSNQLEVLRKKVVDWANWDDSYAFLNEKASAYIDENLNYLTMSALGFRDVVYLDREMRVFHTAHVMESSETVTGTPNDYLELFKGIVNAEIQKGKQEGIGLAQLNGQAILYAFAEILPSKRNEPSRGTLFVSSIVSNEFFKSWAYQTNLRLTFWRWAQDALPADAVVAIDRLTKGERYVVSSGNDVGQQVYALLHDSNGKPIILYSFADDGQILHLAEGVRDYALIGVALSGFFAILLLWWLVDSQVLTRLAKLIDKVGEIAATGDTTVRLHGLEGSGTTLRARVAALVALCFLAMIVVLYTVVSHSLKGALGEIESQTVSDNLIRAERAIDARAKELLGKTQDWGQWDATYEFVLNKAPEYIEANLNYETLLALKIRAVGYFSPDGKLEYGLEVDAQNGATIPMQKQLQMDLMAGMPILSKGESLETLAGILKTQSGLLMVTRSPILDSSREKPSRGSFIFIMSVDKDLFEELSAQTKLLLSMYPLQNSGENPPKLQLVSGREAIGRGILRDVNNLPVAVVQLLLERDLYSRGVQAMNVLLVSLVLTGVFGALFAVITINRFIIAALGRAVGDVRIISDTGDTTKRLEVGSTDEMGTLAAQINSMLDTLARTQAELKMARDAAEAANQAKSTFIAKVSHELRTPIHGVVGMLRILMKEEPSKTKRDYIAMAKHSAFGLLDTINEILDFSKMETGKLSIESIEFSLRDVLRDALRTVAPRAEEKEGVELVVDIQKGIRDSYFGDPLRLKQCLINLLGNSIKFTKQGHVKLEVRSLGRVEGVNAQPLSHQLEFLVSDTGVGIPEDRLPLIFDPFTQADDTVARVFTGTGLGLTIVKQLVEQMNGTVSVTSEVEKGTTFTISAPLPEVPAATWKDAEWNGASVSMAIVDGNSVTASVMNSAAERYGLQSIVVPSADPESISALLNHIERFGLVVVTSEAVAKPYVFNFIAEAMKRESTKVVVILSPFEISIRERLNALGVPLVLMRPASLEDVLLAVSGQYKLEAEVWGSEDEVMMAASRKLRVLIADDAATNRVILTNMLQEAGHEVVSVDNGLDLIEALKGQIQGSASGRPFDLVLTDIQMPMMDGITATREIRALEQAAGRDVHIPMVAVTAHAMSEETSRMRECGVDDVVTKPIHPADLARAISALTDGVVDAPTVGIRHEATPALEAPAVGTPPSELEALQQTAYQKWCMREDSRDIKDYEALEGDPPFEQILNVADVFERSGDSVRRSKLIFRAFTASYGDPLGSLERAYHARDVENVKQAAHALKGLLLDVGAQVTAKLASHVEACCKGNQLEEAVKFIPMLQAQVGTIAKLVGEILSASDAPQNPAKVVSIVTRDEPLPPVAVSTGETSEAVQFLAQADKLVKDTVIGLSESDLKMLVPTQILETGVAHPSVELVYQLLDVHGVVAREGHNTTRSLLIFGAFLHAHEELLRELDFSREGKDIEKLKAVSHTLRNVLADTGCPLGADVARQIEQLCDLGAVDEAFSLCDSLKGQTRLVGTMLRRIVEQCVGVS